MMEGQAWCNQGCIRATLRLQFSVAVVMSILTILISAYYIYMHLQNFNNPFFQSKIIVILIMAPFYCISSLGSFMFPSMQIYLTVTRDSYQAILLFTFFYLMFSYLAYDPQQETMQDKKVYKIMIQHQDEVHHFWPFNYCQKPYQLTHWKKAKYFTYRCKKFVLQFVVIKLVTTLIMYVIFPNQQSVTPWISAFVNWVVVISASYSLYYLVLFYHALRKPLSPYHALLKFLTIKITIFFTFWQKIMITIFHQQLLEVFDHDAPSFQAHTLTSSIQNTLICLEMLVMALAGGLAYTYQSYLSQIASNKGTFGQVLKDTIKAFKNDFRLIKPKKFGFETIRMTQVQLRDVKKDNMKSVVCQIKSNRPIAECMDMGYL